MVLKKLAVVRKNVPIARKSIVAIDKIKKGDYFSEKNISTKRPGTGISPLKWEKVIGQKSKYCFDVDDLIVL